jgi:hypothetical protein
LLTGRLDGMNEHGLSVALHLVGRRRLPGMSCVLMRSDGSGSFSINAQRRTKL